MDLQKLNTAAPKAEIVTLTPELAAQLLGVNTINRPLRSKHAAGLTRAIQRGEWDMNGSPIRVSRSGRLLDGQHRCTAVLESGVAVPVVLVTGLDDAVFATIDNGAKRTTGDALAIMGEANTNALAAITRTAYIYATAGDPYSSNSDHHPTTKQHLDFLESHPLLRDSANWVASMKWCRKYLPPSLAGFCHFVFTAKDPEAAGLFFSGLETGIGLCAGDPVLLLRNRLMEVHKSKSKLAYSYKAALTFKAFKLHRDGATLKYLRVRTEGGSAEKDVFVL